MNNNQILWAQFLLLFPKTFMKVFILDYLFCNNSLKIVLYFKNDYCFYNSNNTCKKKIPFYNLHF